MLRRVWLIALCLYALSALADGALHLREDVRAGQDWRAADNLAVATSAALFWPLDLLARILL